MTKTARTPLIFIATGVKNEPIRVNFFTRNGKMVALDSVRKVKTKKGGVLFYTTSK